MDKETFMEMWELNQDSAIEALYAYYSPRMIAFSRREKLDINDIEDLLQNFWTKIIQKIHLIENVKNLNGYILVAFRNDLIRFKKSRKQGVSFEKVEYECEAPNSDQSGYKELCAVILVFTEQLKYPYQKMMLDNDIFGEMKAGGNYSALKESGYAKTYETFRVELCRLKKDLRGFLGENGIGGD